MLKFPNMATQFALQQINYSRLILQLFGLAFSTFQLVGVHKNLKMSAVRKSRNVKRKREKSAEKAGVKLEPVRTDEMLIQFPFVESFVESSIARCPLTSPATSNNGCTEDCQTSFLEIKAELKALKQIVNDQTQLLNQLASKSNVSVPVNEEEEKPLLSFPLKSKDELDVMESHINDLNRYEYVQRMREVINSNVDKNLKLIMSDDLIIHFNLDGKHGKQKLRDYPGFLGTLLDALNTSSEKDRPEIALRLAIANQKKRIYRRKCFRKASLKQKGLLASEESEDDSS